MVSFCTVSTRFVITKAYAVSSTWLYLSNTDTLFYSFIYRLLLLLNKCFFCCCDFFCFCFFIFLALWQCHNPVNSSSQNWAAAAQDSQGQLSSLFTHLRYAAADQFQLNPAVACRAVFTLQILNVNTASCSFRNKNDSSSPTTWRCSTLCAASVLSNSTYSLGKLPQPQEGRRFRSTRVFLLRRLAEHRCRFITEKLSEGPGDQQHVGVTSLIRTKCIFSPHQRVKKCYLNQQLTVNLVDMLALPPWDRMALHIASQLSLLQSLLAKFQAARLILAPCENQTPASELAGVLLSITLNIKSSINACGL